MKGSVMSKPEYLTKAVAAERLGLSVRRVLEMSLRGELRRHYIRSPLTKRKQTVFAAGEVGALAAAMYRRMNDFGRARGTLEGAGGAPLGARASVSVALPESPPPPASPWLTMREAEAYIGLPASVLEREIAQGRLAAMDVGVREGGRWRIHRQDLDGLRGRVQGGAKGR